MSAYFKEAWRSLYATKQRTLLALVGILIGIGSVIALVSIGSIVTNEATKQFLAMGTDLLSLRLQTPRDDPSLNTPELAMGLGEHTPCLRLAAPFARDSGEYRPPNGEEVDYELLGVTSDYPAVNKLELAAGRFVSDLDAGRAFAVLGAELPRAFGLGAAPERLIGRELELEQGLVTIVGVLAPSLDVRQTHAETNTAVFVPLEYALRHGRHSAIRDVAARMQPAVDQQQCIDEAEQYFLRRNPSIEIRAVTAEELIAQMRKQTDMLNTLLAAIASISLVVGGVGIMNIMLMSVTERRTEIGIRRALGARRRDIRYQFLTEALLLSLVGGALGIIVGVGAAYFVADYQEWEFFITPMPIVLGAGVSAVIGVFFGFFPAHQAAKQDPIAALRGD